MFHPKWRDAALDALDQPFDLVVIGGGITGCGILFDAAQRGLRVLLVEQGDLASGTSSRSSKLLHGGLRYLKNLQFRVTRDSCRERDLQLHLNPHLATPLDWLYPTYSGDRPSGRKIGLGLWIYDRLTDRPQKHRIVSRDEMEALATGSRQDHLDRAFLYQDVRVDDARLTHAVAATGFACGGLVLTYTRVEEGRRDADGRLRTVVLRDLLTDTTHEAEGALVINATGPWTDKVRHRLGLHGNRVRPSRGSHLIFDADAVPVRAAFTMASPDDRRPVFFLPHPEGVLVGTTDLFHHGDLDDPRPTEEEVDYLLRTLAMAFPENPPKREQIRGAFAGVRPVLDSDTDDPSKASREEAVWHESGLLSVAGGKLTTWRATAEEVVDKALRHLPERRRRRATPCATAGTPLAGLSPLDLHLRLEKTHGLSPAVASAMARRLGASAWTACDLGATEDRHPIREDLDLSVAELRTHLRYGAVRTLSDLLLRRVRLGMWRPDQAADLAPMLTEIWRQEMGDASDFDTELERLERDLQAWTLDGVEAQG